MQVYIFPGQGAQFPGMGKELYEASPIGKNRFEQANEILGFNIKDIMFGEDACWRNMPPPFCPNGKDALVEVG